MAVVSYHMGMREVYGAAIRLSGMWGSSLDMTGPFEIVGLMSLGALMHQRYAHKFMRTFSSNCLELVFESRFIAYLDVD
jgi:hypothetical protein